MDDEIEILLAHVTVGREVSVLVLLARSEGELHLGEGSSQGGRGLRSAGRAEVGTGPEAVEVFARGRQSSDLDVDRVRQLRARERVAFPDDISEPLVGGDLPLHRDPPVRHPPIVERVRGQVRPEYDAVR